MDKLGLIKELRERTNGGMVDCKKALEESDWDIEKAITWLKSNGKIKAAKKADRVSAEGLVAIAANKSKAVMVEVNCETDFVARNEKFKALVEKIAILILDSKVKSVDEVLKLKSGKETVADLCENLTATIGEKITFRRFEVVETKKGEILGHFVHVTGQIAAIVKISGTHEESARNVAMHLSAMKPEFIFVKDIPAERIQLFRDEFVVPANFDKKPVKVQEMIREGSLNKKIGEVALEEQPFMMEESLTINKYLANHKGKLVSAIRYGVGEGIQKATSDFASEVAAQMKQ
ncbi:translation elongation factor Ts [Mycoplasmopsis caviae]|uniref:Elongation factor Ts n=1 Tax=Mycoplasmopsis caviae TaxID=55603 RepID=A0A3P8MEW6_9BACT|nr:translation elongation factor Ts [Mycoplasmopsis caviae]UUD34732.1 translation elongation factor Ts [Mycoplasmopsis caviae]VDR42426.1 Elongation factor Ts [Mycoplasmopsis caviae]